MSDLLTDCAACGNEIEAADAIWEDETDVAYCSYGCLEYDNEDAYISIRAHQIEDLLLGLTL